jgi:hypothetical protein
MPAENANLQSGGFCRDTPDARNHALLAEVSLDVVDADAV